MKTRELLEIYPIAAQIVKEHYKKLMIGSMASPEFEEFVTEEVIDHGVTVLLERSPRAILDLLDENGIYSTLVITYEDGNPVFAVDINGAVGAEKFSSRKDAEVSLLENSMMILNNKIS